MRHYVFGDELGWLRPRTRDTNPRQEDALKAFTMAEFPSRHCYVYEDGELVAIIDCTKWAQTNHPEGNARALNEFLKKKLTGNVPDA